MHNKARRRHNTGLCDLESRSVKCAAQGSEWRQGDQNPRELHELHVGLVDGTEMAMN